jgi:glycosyltransferase involved in cell wall biosynthesis
MSEVLISAVLPNYNHAKLLQRSVGALANQTVLPLEIIVVDDASTDNSLDVLDSLVRQHPIVHVHRNERNLGVNASYARGLALARGNYVLMPAADDEVRPDLIKNAVQMFQQYPRAGVFSGICEWRCTASNLTWYKGTGMPARPCYLSPSDMVALAKRGKLAINGQNAVYKKDALIKAGGWLPELQWFGDWFGSYVVGFRHGMCHVPEVLSNFYLYPGSFYNADAGARAKRRAVMERLLDVMESERFADVAPCIRNSGLLGEYGWPMAKVVVGQRRHWRCLTPAFVRRIARRSAERIGRRFFPDPLAKWCLKIFYGHKAYQA